MEINPIDQKKLQQVKQVEWKWMDEQIKNYEKENSRTNDD